MMRLPKLTTVACLVLVITLTVTLAGCNRGRDRTCATCHREDNNLTIDPEFIATLPPNDPLFVAEFVPALANNFEKPVLMRKLGLILENVDGFSAVDFYNSEAFNNAPGFGSLIGGIRLEATEVEAVAAFLRVINALENIRSSVELEHRATTTGNFGTAQELIKLSIAELQDAIEVLSCVGLHPDAQQRLKEALTIDLLAKETSNDFARNVLLLSAISKKNQAKNLMVN